MRGIKFCDLIKILPTSMSSLFFASITYLPGEEDVCRCPIRTLQLHDSTVVGGDKDQNFTVAAANLKCFNLTRSITNNKVASIPDIIFPSIQL